MRRRLNCIAIPYTPLCRRFQVYFGFLFWKTNINQVKMYWHKGLNILFICSVWNFGRKTTGVGHIWNVNLNKLTILHCLANCEALFVHSYLWRYLWKLVQQKVTRQSTIRPKLDDQIKMSRKGLITFLPFLICYCSEIFSLFSEENVHEVVL